MRYGGKPWYQRTLEEIFLLRIFLERQKELSDVVCLRINDGRETFKDEDGSSIIIQSVLLNRIHANRHEGFQFWFRAWVLWKRDDNSPLFITLIDYINWSSLMYFFPSSLPCFHPFLISHSFIHFIPFFFILFKFYLISYNHSTIHSSIRLIILPFIILSTIYINPFFQSLIHVLIIYPYIQQSTIIQLFIHPSV